jgi:hypothetical protein
VSKTEVLLVGESWVSAATHYKGFDQFGSVTFHRGAEPLVDALRDSPFALTYMTAHETAEGFPFTIEALSRYRAIILSDIGANTLLLPQAVWMHGRPMPNRLKLIRDWTEAGGGLVMIGGYLTFQGIDGRGRWRRTPVEDALPVTMHPYDDRIEAPEGFKPEVLGPPTIPCCRASALTGRSCSVPTRSCCASVRTWSCWLACRRSRAATRCSSPGGTAPAAPWPGRPISARIGCPTASSNGPVTPPCGRTCSAG